MKKWGTVRDKVAQSSLKFAYDSKYFYLLGHLLLYHALMVVEGILTIQKCKIFISPEGLCCSRFEVGEYQNGTLAVYF